MTNTIKKLTMILVSACLPMASANATLLTSNINMDNSFVVYVSTDNSTAGTSFGSGNNWPSTITDSTTLTTGVDYYLHVLGNDAGGIAGFLGEFSLSGADHVFSNSTTSLLTNTTDWVASLSGFDGTYSTTMTDLGANGVSPWGTIGAVDSSARWIWAGDANTVNVAYFSASITAVPQAATTSVPEPGTIALFGLGLAGLGFARRKKA